MKININTNNTNPTFGLIELKPSDRQKSEGLLRSIIKHSEVEKEKNIFSIKLYDLFEPYIIEEGALHARNRYPLEDIVSDFKVKFWEFIYELNPRKNIDDLINQINELKPYTFFLKPSKETKNIDEKIPGTDKLHYIDTITENHLPVPQSEVEKEKIKKKLNNAIKNTEITPKTKELLKQRSKGLSYQKIADKKGISKTTAQNTIKQGILKIQHKNSVISKDNNKKIQNVAKTLGITFEEAKNIALRKIEILSYSSETLKNNKKSLENIFGVKQEDINKIILKNPTIIGRKPETINQNMENSAKLLGISKSDFLKTALKHVYLISENPETINQNVENSAKLLEITKSDFIKMGLKRPELLYRNPKTLFDNVENSSKLFEIPKERFIQAAKKQPQLFYLKSETLNKNIESSAKILNISKTDFFNAAIKHPELFYRDPNTLNKNIETLAYLLNITKADCTNIAIKQPQLFYLNPENLNQNIETSARLLGISKKDFIFAATKQPQLFYLKPENLNANIESTAKSLNISKAELVHSALKQPTIFYLKSESLEKKSKILNYYKKVKKTSGDIKVTSYYNKSEDKLYKDILIHLIYKKISEKIPKTKIEANFTEIINSFKCPIIFTIPADETAESFIKFANEYSIKTIGKNVFKFIIKK